MTPEEVYALDDETYTAFATFQRDELKARERAAKKRG